MEDQGRQVPVEDLVEAHKNALRIFVEEVKRIWPGAETPEIRKVNSDTLPPTEEED